MLYSFLTIIFWQWLQKVDEFLFTQINSHFTNSFLDTVLPWARESMIWVPLYLFLLVFVFINFGRKAWGYIVFLLLTVLVTDQISSHLIKVWVQRPRPCADLSLQIPVRLLLGGCSGGYSFTSSHATNHFGVAIFVFVTLSSIFKKWKWLLILWAALISYAQIYVGVHYPSDVLCGAILGSFIGYCIANFYKHQHKIFIL
jgi:undecaprenyl-diphosphatase